MWREFIVRVLHPAIFTNQMGRMCTLTVFLKIGCANADCGLQLSCLPRLVSWLGRRSSDMMMV